LLANILLWLGSERRLNPNHLPSARCAQCSQSQSCLNSAVRGA